MRASIISVGSFWYTAWLDAGSSLLDSLKVFEMSDEMKKEMEAQDKLWRSGKPAIGKGHSDD